MSANMLTDVSVDILADTLPITFQDSLATQPTYQWSVGRHYQLNVDACQSSINRCVGGVSVIYSILFWDPI